MSNITIMVPDSILAEIPPRPAAVTGLPRTFRDSRDFVYLEFEVGKDIARVMATSRTYNRVAWVEEDGSWGSAHSPRFLPAEQRAEVQEYLLAVATAYATFTELAGLPRVIAAAMMDAADVRPSN